MSDSTLRCVEQVGLRADVFCALGAGIGHLANAIRDDPAMKDTAEVTLVTGLNDIRETEYNFTSEFVFNMDRSLEKLKAEVTSHPGKILTVAYMKDDPVQLTLRPSQALQEKYLEKALVELQSMQIGVVAIPAANIRDKMNHHTVTGTRTIVEILDYQSGEKIIYNASYLTSDRMYAGVHAAFRYGCQTCNQLGAVPRSLGYLSRLWAMDQYLGEEEWAAFEASLNPSPPLQPAGSRPLARGGDNTAFGSAGEESMSRMTQGPTMILRIVKSI